MNLENILAGLHTLPVEILPEPTGQEQQADAAEPVITLVMFEREKAEEREA